jgi:hypothetical protein
MDWMAWQATHLMTNTFAVSNPLSLSKGPRPSLSHLDSGLASAADVDSSDWGHVPLSPRASSPLLSPSPSPSPAPAPAPVGPLA